MKFGATLALLSSLISTALAVSFIVPGAVWTDTSGAKILAHGGHVMQVGSTFYWLGYGAAAGVIPNIYQSTDLMNWSHIGFATNQVSGMYRPKFITSGGKWYIWGQVNREIVTLVAPGSSPASTAYTLTGSPALLPPDARSFSDMGVFVDDNGKSCSMPSAEYSICTGSAYFLSSADSNNLQINNINGGSPITIGTRVADIGASIEAPGMLKANGTYFLVVSQKTGWSADPDKVYSAPAISGPWSGASDIAPESTNTYNSQNSAELKITGSSATTYVFLGDIWDSTGSDASNYEWLPISVSTASKTLTLQDLAMWKINPGTGVVASSNFVNTTFNAADGIIGGSAVINKRAVHNITPSSNVTFTNVLGNGLEKQWVAFEYTVNNRTAGEAHVSVNGGPPIMLSALNSRAGHRSTVPVALALKEGSNIITFGVRAVDGGDFAAHLERIQVFEDY